MKPIISAFLMFLIAIVAIAQEPTDAIAVKQLKSREEVDFIDTDY